MKYIRYNAPPEMRLRFHFRDKFGHDIYGAREYDPSTGEGKRLKIGLTDEDENNLVEFFAPQGYVEIDGHTNPTEEALATIFEAGKASLNPEVMNETVKRTEEHVRFEKGTRENNPQETTT